MRLMILFLLSLLVASTVSTCPPPDDICAAFKAECFSYSGSGPLCPENYEILPQVSCVKSQPIADGGCLCCRHIGGEIAAGMTSQTTTETTTTTTAPPTTTTTRERFFSACCHGAGECRPFDHFDAGDFAMVVTMCNGLSGTLHANQTCEEVDCGLVQTSVPTPRPPTLRPTTTTRAPTTTTTRAPTTTTTTTTERLCGNGVLDEGEECDPGLPTLEHCSRDCKLRQDTTLLVGWLLGGGVGLLVVIFLFFALMTPVAPRRKRRAE